MVPSSGQSSQRRRLLDGMVAAAARYGFGGASVARVIREAGVSRATFYEHFSGRDDCFSAAYQMVAEQIEATFEPGSDDSPGKVLGVLLRSADRNPAAARVGLIEGLGGNPDARRRHEELLDNLESRIERYLREPPDGSPPYEIPARAVLGGVTGVVAVRIFRGEAGRLEELRDDLVAWVESYTLPEGRERRAARDWQAMGPVDGVIAEDSLGADVLGRNLPRGRGALSPTQVAREQRRRVFAAVAELSREKGYAPITVADLVATAGISRDAFYEHFRNKEDAFLAAQAFGLEESVAYTVSKYFGEATWPDRVWEGLEATLGYVAGQRSLVYVDLVESYAAGNVAIRRSFDNRMAYTLFLEEGYRQRPEASALPRLVSEGVAGAIQELFRRQVVGGRGGQMLELLPLVAYLALAPFIGVEPALDLVESKLRARAKAPPGPPARA